jgi:sec-independent protein translocase protein TatB
MEIFNIHIFEFLLIGGLALIVFGPERLPEVGRFIGKQVARFLAWQQQSPELKMLNDIRGEFESEIASLRDELTRARNDLNVQQEIQQEMAALRDELKPMLDLRSEINPSPVAETAQPAASGFHAATDAAPPTIAPPQPGDAADALTELAPEIKPAGQAVQAATRPNRIVALEPTQVLQPPAPPEIEPVVDPPIDAVPETLEAGDNAEPELDAPEAVPSDAPDAPDAPEAVPSDPPEAADPASITPDADPASITPDADPASITPDADAGASAPQTDDIQTPEALASGILHRLDTLSGELHALVAILRDRGVLDDDWRPAAIHDEESVA